MTEDYFDWLCSLACPYGGGSESTLLFVFKKLFEYEYHGQFPNDANRELDGKELRIEYEKFTGIKLPNWEVIPCTFFEMIIGLARRIEQMMEGFVRTDSTKRWICEMLVNLKVIRKGAYGFEACTDVEERIERFLNRDIGPDGEGGLFPLISPERDQRNIELWYQMADYLNEQYDI